MAVLIASWNVNSIRARKERLLAWLEHQMPDVLCIQETKVVDGDFPREDMEGLGYHPVIWGQKSYNGVAILSREAPQDIVCGFGDGGDDSQARFVAATVAGVRVLCVYVPNGKSPDSDAYYYKLEWMGRLRNYLDRTAASSQPLVLCGDFNVAPEDRDVHDPFAWKNQIHCTEPEREALRSIERWGLVDTFRQREPEGGHYSWWDYRMLGFQKNRGLRIDLVLATEPLARVCTAAAIDRQERKGKGASDHAPVLARFEGT